jgi:ornithine cyclodeaminase/alanine dehydrogenase-like protein (mu-crystallin family)
VSRDPFELLVLSGDNVARLLPMRDCIPLMADTLAALADGRGLLPLRTVMSLPDEAGWLYTMPAFAAKSAALAVKMITIFPANHGGPLPSHQGVVVLFDAADGRPVALIDATELTALRTAAVSAVATRALARAEAGDLALLGAGVQARAHLEALPLVRPIHRVRVWSRNAERAAAFARAMTGAHGLAVEAVADARAAVDGADIICVATAARAPVLCGEWLTAGTHINAIGASTPQARELDSAAVRRARVYVDRREAALAEAGDLLIPIAEGVISPAHIVAELGEVLAGRAGGRMDADEITLFKSLGLAVEDAAAARLLYDRAAADPTLPVARLAPRSDRGTA